MVTDEPAERCEPATVRLHDREARTQPLHTSDNSKLGTRTLFINRALSFSTEKVQMTIEMVLNFKDNEKVYNL